MPALCSILSGTYYAQNYASIISGSLSIFITGYDSLCKEWPGSSLSALPSTEGMTAKCAEPYDYLILRLSSSKLGALEASNSGLWLG